MKKSALILCLLLLVISGSSQVSLKDSIISASIINIDLGAGIPGENLAERFGPHATVGGGYQFKTQTNWLFGISGGYIFGDVVREDSILDPLKNDAGFIIGNDGLQYNPILAEQGFDVKLQVGKITQLLSVNPNSGVAFIGGIGFVQHHILIYIDEAIVPQLSGDYRKGYDRMSNGLMLNQYVGYYLFGNKHFVNFRGGIELQEAFTKSRRSFNYDVATVDKTQRFDMMITLKISWNLPIFEKPPRRFYYN